MDTYPEIKIINFNDVMSDENISIIPISQRFNYFKENYVINNQFVSIINNNKYVFNFEAYDSTSVYKPFFFYEIKDGIMITTANPKYGNINIMMELGYEIHVNYYFKYSVTDKSIYVDLNKSEWIEWFSQLSYILGYRLVVFHSNYSISYDKNDTIKQKQDKYRYTFSQDIYMYLKYKKMYYVFDEIIPNFDYIRLDYLENVPIDEVIKSSDRNELYQIAQMSGKKNMKDLYIYVIENIPKLIKIVEEKMDYIFEPEKNPFKNITYTLDPWQYWYNHNLIKNMPSENEFNIKKDSYKKFIGDNKIPKFKNRLRTYLLNK